jgi:hypothetical protein
MKEKKSEKSLIIPYEKLMRWYKNHFSSWGW